MPGPVSDSYDPEFGTGANADEVRELIRESVVILNDLLGPELKDIVQVAHGPAGQRYLLRMSERYWRALRFAANRSLETL